MKPSVAILAGVTLLIVVDASTAQMTSNAVAGKDSRVDLVLASFGYVNDCPTCRLVEFEYAGRRQAYFVGTEVVCSLTPVHIESTNPEIPEARSIGFAILSAEGRAEMARCANATSTEMPELAVVLGNDVVGITRASPSPSLNGFLVLEYPSSLDELRRVLE